MNDQRFFDLSAKRLSATISSQEEDELTQYLEEQPDQRIVFRELENHWNESGKLRLKYTDDPQGAWEKFSGMKSDHQPKTVRWVHFAYRLAAMVVLTVGLGFLFREFGKTEPYHYATFEGEIKWIMLPDSSHIRLNESTLLTVASDFNENDRNVILEGEAFFEIARDENRPFIIETNEAKTHVLGTSFNIRALEEEPQVEIYVVSGKVSFSAGEKELILTKGMAANYNKAGEELALIAESQNALAWHSQTLKFEDTPLGKVFADLEQYFDVEIAVTNENLKNCRFTGEFKKPNLEEILKIISISADITYSKNNNRYTIDGEGCSPVK
ncbi:MAG: FecR domain-containing protein [Reichenbachiella sp.]|uniref:FecR family protein n=1 Tax=Reichenbachiella sp. TaxID=2184521 RepID=UPI003264492C